MVQESRQREAAPAAIVASQVDNTTASKAKAANLIATATPLSSSAADPASADPLVALSATLSITTAAAPLPFVTPTVTTPLIGNASTAPATAPSTHHATAPSTDAAAPPETQTEAKKTKSKGTHKETGGGETAPAKVKKRGGKKTLGGAKAQGEQMGDEPLDSQAGPSATNNTLTQVDNAPSVRTTRRRK
jgi:hypothetical protein